MKKFFLALSIALAVLVTTSCGVKAPDGQVAITLKNNLILSTLENVDLVDADTDISYGTVVKAIKFNKKGVFFADEGAEVYFKYTLVGEKCESRTFTADEDKEVKYLDIIF